jgi:plastocyanin
MLRAGLFAVSSLVALTAIACGGTNSPTASVSSPYGVAGGHLGTPAMTIQATDDDVFRPATQKVTLGQIVEWQNAGSVAHNIVFADDATLGDPVLEGGGGVWQVKFSKAGTYQYSCTIHTGMVGMIVVSSG